MSAGDSSCQIGTRIEERVCVNMITKTRLSRGLGLGLLLVTAFGAAAAGISNSKGQVPTAPSKPKLANRTAADFKTSLRFVENQGQWDSRAKLLGRGSGIDTWVTENSVLFDLFKVRQDNREGFKVNANRTIPRFYKSGHIVEMSFVGGRTAETVTGWGELPGKSNFLKGKNPVTGAGHYEEARMRGVYHGIDTRVYFDAGRPRYDMIVNPGGDPSQIQIEFKGADRVSSRSATEITLKTSMGNLAIGGLYAYQQNGGRKVQVPASFTVDASGKVGFRVGTYDRTRPLVIDPIVYSSYLGGTGSSDLGFGISVDRFNNAYVAGLATAPTFPTSIGAYDEELLFVDGFVSKFLDDGSDLVYSTYVGGTTIDPGLADFNGGPENFINAIAVDFDGAAYVVGSTACDDFDVTAGSGYLAAPPDPDRTFDDFYNAFIMKIAPDGTSREWARFIGGSRFDMANAIALGADNSAYVVGVTQSEDFSIVGALQDTMKGDGDAFLTKITPDGSAETYSTYLGGTDTINPDDPNDPDEDPDNPFDNRNTHADDDQGVGVKVDTDGFAYVLLGTSFNDAPKVAGSYDTVANGSDALVLKVAIDGGSLVFGTFLGGNAAEAPVALDIDGTGNVYVTGNTNSFNFPRTTGAFDRVYNLGIDCFLTKLNRLGNGLIHSGFLGMTNGGRPTALEVDDIGFAHVAGWISQSTNTATWLPVTANADDPTYNGPVDPFLSAGDAFLLVMNDTGTALQYCSYFGGTGADQALGIGLDGPRNAYLTGATDSFATYPVTEGAFKVSMVPLDGGLVTLPDAFVTKVKTRIPLTITGLTLNPTSIAGGATSTGTVTISAPASNGGQLVTIANDNNSVVTTPTSVTIPAGATSTTFNIQTNANIVVQAVVRITATVEGDSKSANLTVSPWLEAFTLSNTTVVGGNPIAARVTLAFPAPTGGMTINLSSSVPTVATMPSSITVAEGTTTSVFDVTTFGVNSLQTVDLNASLFGLTRTQQLDVVPARLFAISLNPARVSGGTSSNGIVQLDGAAPPGGVTINLASNDPAVTVPASVFIPAQEQTATFEATTTVVNVNTTATVTATLGTDSVNTTLDVLVANLISITISPDSVLGGNSTTGTVGLDQPAAAGGVVITLASSDDALAQVPATVTIPSGSTNASFTITTSLVATTQNVTIFADRDDAGPILPLSAGLEIREATFSLDISPSQVPGGTGATGTVTLDEAAPSGGITLNLSSDDSAVQVPTSVTVPAGETEASFNLSTSTVVTDTTATISAEYLGGSATDTLTVLAAVPLNLTVNPSSVVGGNTATGTVTLSGEAAAGGVTVTLSSDNAAATVPGSVTVTEGQISASFTINTTGVLNDVTATITATVGAVSVTDTLVVSAAGLIEVRFSPSRVRGGALTTLTVRLDSAAPPGGAVVSLTSSDPSLATIPATITIDANTFSKTVSIPTRRVSRSLATQVSATYGDTTLFTILVVGR